MKLNETVRIFQEGEIAMKYRKKPVTVEAIQWNGNNTEEVASFLEPGTISDKWYNEDLAIGIWNKLEGCYVRCPRYHWIIKGVQGEFYPCDPEVFEKTYEIAEERTESEAHSLALAVRLMLDLQQAVDENKMYLVPELKGVRELVKSKVTDLLHHSQE